MTRQELRFGTVVLSAGLIGVVMGCADTGTRDVTLAPAAPSGQITPPTVDTPTGDVQLTTIRPTLTIRNSTSPTGTRTYEFQVSDRTDFSASQAFVSRSGVAEGVGGTTSFTPTQDLQVGTRLYWRARATVGADVSEWSAVAQFRTRIGGYSRPGELYDPLIFGDTIGTSTGSTTFLGSQGLRVDNANSFVRFQLASTLTSGEISVEVEGLRPNMPHEKARIFSMMDGGSSLFTSNFLFNVQYRGVPGNPDNAISYKLLHGGPSFQYEPDFAVRAAGVRALAPGTTYLWTATWGSSFRLLVREGGPNGPVVYDRTHATPGTYNPTPHTAYLGANDASIESGSFAGAIYRNLWVGSGPRPATIGSALRPN